VVILRRIFSRSNDGDAGGPLHLRECGNFTVAGNVVVKHYEPPEIGFSSRYARLVMTTRLSGEFGTNGP
ncbi:MAG: hypothetical protein ACI9JD_005011, partial [Rhodococcus sp. (in: high G+C Gram-positive bacteria)]